MPDAHVMRKVREEAEVAAFSAKTGTQVVVLLPAGLVAPRNASPTPLGGAILVRPNGDAQGGLGLEGAFPVVDVRDVAQVHGSAMEIDDPHGAYLVVAETIGAQDWSDLVGPSVARPVGGSAAFAPGLIRAIEGSLGPGKFWQGYGLTEAMWVSASTCDDPDDKRLNTVGRPSLVKA